MIDMPKYVEIETSRFCNRVCAWCPNSVLLNRRSQELMPWNHLTKALMSLSRHNYSGWLALHNYNEPLANPRLVAEIQLAVQLLPNASPAVYTNGDRLTGHLFTELLFAGVKQIRITLYPKSVDSTPQGHKRLRRWIERRSFLSELLWEEEFARQGPVLRHSGCLDVIVIYPEVDRYYDRGGTIGWLSGSPRTPPCFLTSHSLSVDYMGDVKMCCNVVSGSKDHARYVLGNIASLDLIELWNSPQFVEIRSRHRASDWSKSPICVSCSQQINLSQ